MGGRVGRASGILSLRGTPSTAGYARNVITPFSRWILAGVALIGACALSRRRFGADEPAGAGAAAGRAGGGTGSAPVNPMCPRLEAQLATIDRGGTDPAKDDQIRRYQDAATKQQAELDRVTLQAKRMGCDSSGFFSLFSGQSAQCGPVNNQIQQMRSNMDQITSSLERLRSGGLGGADRENQRRSVLTALAQNNCGPQYANAAAAAPATSSTICSATTITTTIRSAPSADLGPQSGTFRTVCVRSCDGAYFPISFATVPARFPDDEKTCKALCPAADATLFAYRNPGEDMNQAVSISGQPYTSSPNAFRFRQEFNPSLLLQGRRPDLVRRAEEHRRQGRRRTAGRHHRHRGQREEDGAALAGEGSRDDREEGRRRHHRYRARLFAAGRFHLPHQSAGRETRSAPSARPSSRRARDPIPRMLQPTRFAPATGACRRAWAAAGRRRGSGW